VKNHKVIGVCLSRIYFEHQTDMIKSLCKSASGKHFKLLIFNTFVYLNENPNDPERKMFEAINYNVLDGLVIIPDYIRNDEVVSELAEKAKSRGIPVVIMDGHVDGCYCLKFDFTTAFEKIVRHIVEDHGCKKVDFIAAYKGNPYSEARLDCYKKVLAENNIPFEEERVYYGDFEYEFTGVLIEEMAAKGDFPEAVICANDEMALGACDSLYKKGVKCPDDILVTGFDGVLQERYHTPRLTTCCLEWEEVTEKIIDIFEKKFNGKEPERDTAISYRLQKRQSCGCEPLIITDANYHANANARYKKLKTDFSEKMFESSHKISSSRSYDEFFKELEEEITLISCKTLRCCLLDGFITEDFAERTIFVMDKINSFDSTTGMNMSFGWKNGKRLEPCSFLRSELLPDIKTIVESEEEGHLFFFPACHKKYFIGFVSMEFNLNEVDFGNVFNYMTIFSSNIGFVKSNHDMYQAVTMLKYMYLNDTMTDLFNRRGFYSEINDILSQPQNPGTYLIIFSIDLDGMKYINDNFGHHEGDNAIKVIANVIQSASMDLNAVSSRFGGDEFLSAVITDNPEQAAPDFQNKFLKLIEKYNSKSSKPYKVQSSIGYAYDLVTNLEKNVDGLIKIADTSMYHDKKSRKTHRTSERVD